MTINVHTFIRIRDFDWRGLNRRCNVGVRVEVIIFISFIQNAITFIGQGLVWRLEPLLVQVFSTLTARKCTSSPPWSRAKSELGDRANTCWSIKRSVIRRTASGILRDAAEDIAASGIESHTEWMASTSSSSLLKVRISSLVLWLCVPLRSMMVLIF
jgi:hypothetical protein